MGTFVDKPGEDSFYFKDDKGTEATFTRGITKEGNFKLLGNVLYSDGRDFTLEPCLAFKDCHVWMEEDESHWVDEGSVAVTKEEMLDAVLNRRTPDPEKMEMGRSDSTTVVTYTVMFYYTPEFAAVTEDIPLFVSQVIAETNRVNVHFKTDYSVTKTGWRLTYSLIPASGEVTSENYPENYNNDMDKTYPVEVATGKGIRITFNDFDIESHSSCDYDYVMIKEANGNELLNKSCGDTIPADVTSIQNKVDILFHSDYSVTKKGFKLTWTEV